jgi:hypothetical protein
MTMNSIDFCFWLQGYFEICHQAKNGNITAEKAAVIRDHLSLVFKHEIDPLRESETTATKAELNKIHNGNDPKMRC